MSHVRPCLDTSLHDRAARATMARRIAARPRRTCDHGVTHCCATAPHVRPWRDALLHDRDARATMVRRIAA